MRPTQERVQRLFSLNEAGELVWANPTSIRVKAGELAGSGNGLRRFVRFDGKRYPVAAVKILHKTGIYPIWFVDAESLSVFADQSLMLLADEAESAREMLNYDAVTGVFTWKIRPAKCVRIGAVVGSIHKLTGYARTRMFGREILLHRLAWLYVNGEWPAGQVDHIDGNKLNNAIGNLRDVTASVNQQNLKKATSRSSTGLLGVIKSGKLGYKAVINVDGKNVHIGSFESAACAHAAYLEAKRLHHAGNTL